MTRIPFPLLPCGEMRCVGEQKQLEVRCDLRLRERLARSFLSSMADAVACTALAVRWSPDWRPLGECPSVAEGECNGAVGDCLFACLGAWLDVARGGGAVAPAASLMRALAVGSLRDDMCEMVCDDLCSDTGLERPRTREALQELMLDRDRAWGSESFLVLWLEAAERLLACGVCAAIVSGSDLEPLIVSCGKEPEIAVCLRHVNGNHYRLLGSSKDPGAVVFRMKTRAWARSAEDCSGS